MPGYGDADYIQELQSKITALEHELEDRRRRQVSDQQPGDPEPLPVVNDPGNVYNLRHSLVLYWLGWMAGKMDDGATPDEILELAEVALTMVAEGVARSSGSGAIHATDLSGPKAEGLHDVQASQARTRSSMDLPGAGRAGTLY